MSLVTRCPACATPFKVVKDQLRISDGWVRCGRCSQVFDATLDLHDTSELPPEVAAQSPSPVADEIDALPREADGANESALLAQSPPVELPQMDVEEIRAADVEAEFFDDQQDVEKENAGPAHPSSMAATSPQADDEEDDELSSSAPPAGMAMPDVVWPDADMLSFEDKGRVAIRPPAPAPLSFPDIDLSLPSRPAAPAIAPEIPAADASATD